MKPILKQLVNNPLFFYTSIFHLLDFISLIIFRRKILAVPIVIISHQESPATSPPLSQMYTPSPQTLSPALQPPPNEDHSKPASRSLRYIPVSCPP